jgi:TolA protein
MEKRKVILRLLKTRTKINNLGLVPFIILSVIFHSLVFWICFYNKTKQDFFVQVPFEVSFYSPVESKTGSKVNVEKKVNAEEKKVIEEIKKEEVKEQKINKDDIVVKKKKDTKKKKKIEKKAKQQKAEQPKAEQPKTEQPKNEQTVVKEGNPQGISGTGSQASSNSKGIMLENKNFKYSYYTNTIVKKIRKYWQWSQVTEGCRAVVYFRILKDGSVAEVKIKESSKNEDFDQNAIRSVILSGPFAPLPSGYNENYLGVYFEFKYN